MKLGLGIAVALGALATAPAWAGDEVLSGPAPAWVVQHPARASAPPEADLPLEILQLDNQVHAEGNTVTRYSKVLVKFLNAQGLSAGNLSYSWEPQTDDLTVHKVLIHRGDQTIDVLASGQTFTVLRREQNLEQATLTGTLTANLFPEGLQVGDVLETQTTRSTTNPVTGAHAEEILGPFNFPAAQIDASIEWSKDKPMRLAATGDLPQWKRGHNGGFEIASMTLENVQPLIPPRNAPGRFGVIRMAEATDYRSWAEVADTFVPLYDKASQIPADGALRAELEKIRATSKDPVKRAEDALQLVESRTRYVALVMGTGGLIPADVTQTWARRFGDCKAKTALLLGLLRELGIEAEPVIVNTDLGDAINDRLPAVSLFNHILVRATIAGRTYWLDGTRTGDTSLARLTTPDFGWGLPIHKGSATLVHIQPQPLDRPDSELTIQLDATKGIRGDVPATLELLLRGDKALGTSQSLASLAGSARDQALKEYWHGEYDFITADKVGMAFDDKTGELHLTMQGTAKMEWKGGWFETDAMGVGYKPDFTRAAGTGHDAPFSVGYPYFEKARETILLPPGFGDKPMSDKSEVDETVAGVEYHRHASMTGNRFVIERTERSLVPEIPYKDALAAEPRLRDLNDRRIYLRIPSGYRATTADLAVLKGSTSDDVAELVQQGRDLWSGGKMDDAINRFTKATEVDPQNADGWANLGFSKAWQGKTAEARAALDKAAAIQPANVVLINGRGVLAEIDRDYKAAIALYDRVLALDADNPFAMAHRAMARMSDGQQAEALAEADEGLRRHPDIIELYNVRIYAAMQKGDRAEAIAAVDRMMAANPGNAQAIAVAGTMYRQLGEAGKASVLDHKDAPSGGDTALGLLSKSQARDPSDVKGRLADLSEAIRLEPDSVPALTARASLYSSQGRAQEALADNAAAIAQSPKAATLYLQKANILHAAGRDAETLAVAEALVAALPGEAYAHVAAGKIYSALGKNQDASVEVEKAIAIKPEAYLYLNRAAIRPFDDVDAKLGDVEKALEMTPDFVEALYMKADLLNQKKRYAEAAGIFTQMLKKNPDNSSMLNARGIALWRAGQHEQAERDFQAARDRASSAMQFNSLCYPKAVAGVALDRALAECDEALRLLPDFAPVLDSRATVYLQMGRYRDAKAEYDRVLDKMPGTSTSLLGRAIARFRLGDVAGAKADAAAARKLDKDAIRGFQSVGVAVPPELVS